MLLAAVFCFLFLFFYFLFFQAKTRYFTTILPFLVVFSSPS
jgi:hypothetical protein